MARNVNFKVITINVPEQYLECIQNLIDLDYFPSRSEAIRQSLKQFLNKENNFVEEISSPIFYNLKEIQMNALIGSK